MPKSHNVDIAMVLSLNSIQHPGLLIMASDLGDVSHDIQPHRELENAIDSIRERLETYQNEKRMRSLTDRTDCLLEIAISLDCANKLGPYVGESLLESSINRKLFAELRELHPIVGALAIPFMGMYYEFYDKGYIEDIERVRARLRFLSDYTVQKFSGLKMETIKVDNFEIRSMLAGLYLLKTFDTKSYERHYTKSELIPGLIRYRAYISNDFSFSDKINAPVIGRKMLKVVGDKPKLLNIMAHIDEKNVNGFLEWVSNTPYDFGTISMNDVMSALIARYRTKPKDGVEFVTELLIKLKKANKIVITDLNLGVVTDHSQALEIYPMVEFAWAFMLSKLKREHDPLVLWLDKYQYKKNNSEIKNMLATKTKKIMDLGLAINCKALKIKRGILINHFSQGFGGLFCKHVE